MARKLRFVYAGAREDEEVTLGARVMREIQPAIAADLSEAGYADLQVSRSELSPGLMVRSLHGPLSPDDDQDVRSVIGRSIVRNLMGSARRQAKIMETESGQFVTGGTVDGKMLGL